MGRTYAERFPPGRGRFVRRGAPPHIVRTAFTPEAEQPVEADRLRA